MNYDEFVSRWNTLEVTAFGGGSTALVAQYEAESNLPIIWGDASQWINNPLLLQVYEWIQNDPADSNQAPNRGNIIVWSDSVAFYDRAIDHSVFMAFGQGLSGQQAHFMEASWDGVVGWYIPKGSYVPPAAVVVSTPPLPQPKPPTAPLPVILAETYELVAEVPTYLTPMDAAAQASPTGHLGAGQYYVYADGDGVLNISIDNMHQGFWINESENVVPPPPKEAPPIMPNKWVSPRASSVVPTQEAVNSVPEASEVPEEAPVIVPPISWKDSYIPYPEPRHYVCNVSYPATNIDPEGRKVSIMIRAGEDVTVYGHFLREGIKFYRLHAKSDVEYILWVAVPAVHKDRAVLVTPAPSWADRIFHRYQQTMTSIFPVKVDGEDRYIDSVKLEPFKKPTKWRKP